MRAEGFEPSRAFGSTDFRALYGFRRPAAGFESRTGFGVWTIPSPAPDAPVFRRCPSSLYTFPEEASSGLGSGLPLQVSPNLGSSASPVSRRALKFSFKSVASACSATPAWLVNWS